MPKYATIEKIVRYDLTEFPKMPPIIRYVATFEEFQAEGATEDNALFALHRQIPKERLK